MITLGQVTWAVCSEVFYVMAMEELKGVLIDALERIDRIETQSTEDRSPSVVPSTVPSSSATYVGFNLRSGVFFSLQRRKREKKNA